MGHRGFCDSIPMIPCPHLLGRKWCLMDITNAFILLSVHCLSLFAPFYFTWGAFRLAFWLEVVTGLGVTLSFHRNLAHRSFRLPKFLEYLFAYCAVHSLQGSPIEWVSTHWYHHQYTDTEKDAHSPHFKGFWYSYVGWTLDNYSRFQRCGGLKNVDDLKKQPFYVFLHHTYLLHSFILAVILYATGGLPFLVWAVGVRIAFVFHITFFVNTAAHMWGYQAWNTNNQSKNVWWLAVLSFGEGWHNNHHAFEYSARHGLEWWQIDITWCIIKFLEALGFATDVKLPSMAHKQRMAFKTKPKLATPQH